MEDLGVIIGKCCGEMFVRRRGVFGILGAFFSRLLFGDMDSTRFLWFALSLEFVSARDEKQETHGSVGFS